MFNKVLPMLVLGIFLAGEAGAVAKKQQASRPTAVIIFINSSDIKQIALVRAISRQLYYSQQLKKKLTVTFIDINLSENSFSGPANYLKDPTGLWAEKYRPTDIPALFCVKGVHAMQLKMENAGDVRLCL